jgi:hypothetical protein
MIPAYSLSDIAKYRPCKERLAAVRKLNLRGKITAKQAVKAGVSFDDLVWAASAISLNDLDVKLRLTGWMADVAAHVLYIFENQRPNDDRPRKAIEATHQFIRGNISEKKWAAEAAGAWATSAAGAAWAAEAAGATEAAGAAWAAWATEATGVAWATEATGVAWATSAAGAAWAASAAKVAWAAGAAGATEAAWAAERQWQLDRLVYWFSKERPKFYPLQARAA